MRTKLAFTLVVALLCVATMTWAAGKGYQVTGPVKELTDTKIVVEKAGEPWEVARTPDTKVTGELKVGEKVTVYYTMTATDIEVKTSAAKPEKKKEKE
jgi:ribosomal protein S1